MVAGSTPVNPKYTNRLARETSPYLLQHAHNPVDWYAWSPEALERASREDKPILLSIGYAACHWCHVMERESFENEDIARQMNEGFVCIKVDREERPDLDDIYMQATVAISGHGGWPMTVFLTPDQRPFFAGTYFPPRDAYGRPGFATVLQRIAELWREDRQRLLEQAQELTQHLSAQASLSAAGGVRAEDVTRAVRTLALQYDPRFGGFGSAPKFPPHTLLRLLVRHCLRSQDAWALEMLRGTLDGMRRGGIYDHLAGGFARYSTDDRWLVPHFEKMLYDNGQLARSYLEAYQVTGTQDYRDVAVETLDYALREMQGPAGGFFSATDADSEGVEGKFFVFTPAEVQDVLDPQDAEWACRYYDISEQGNWEGKSILHTPRSLSLVAYGLDVDEQVLRDSLARSREALYQARLKRVPPLLDDKVLVSWNGLMIAALAEASRVLDEARYLEGARRAARFVLDHMRRADGGLYRTHREGRSHLDAYLEDYAYFADALIDLYEAGADVGYLGEAERLTARILQDFDDPDGGGFFSTSQAHEPLIVRMREGQDHVMPNPNAVAARCLLRLSYHLDRPEWRARAERAVNAHGQLVARAPRAFATTLEVAQALQSPPVEIALLGSPGDPGYQHLRSALARCPLVHRIIAHHDPDAPGTPTYPPPSQLPLLDGKTTIAGRAALYICRNFACSAPLTPEQVTAEGLAQLLQGTPAER